MGSSFLLIANECCALLAVSIAIDERMKFGSPQSHEILAPLVTVVKSRSTNLLE